MKYKIILVLTLIFLLSNIVVAQNYDVTRHNINVNVNVDGTAEISEKFYLYFNSEQDKFEFRQKSLEFGSSLNQWEEFNPIFMPTIGLNNVINGKIAYNESEESFLEIKYGLSDALMAKGKETNLMEEFNIKATYLNNLFESGLWIIPDNTTLSIELPAGAELVDTVSPDAIINLSGNKRIITWEGYKSANRLTLKYVLWKKINPILDLNELTNFLFRTNEGFVIIGIFLIIIGSIIWKRKYFSSKIESFVENNTIFEEND
jgi:hypothetical protein